MIIFISKPLKDVDIMNFMLPTGGFDLAGYQAAMIAAAAQMAQESAQAAAKAVSNFK